MPRTRSRSDKTIPAPEFIEMDGVSLEVSRLARVLALKTVKDLPQNQQISFLGAAGYEPAEIAEMVRTSPAVVSQTLYSMRKGKKQTKKPKKK
jgi:hypothetical protein